MTAYSFRPRFRAPILAGTKRQTIRSERKHHARPGGLVHLYTGMRTKQCAIIGIAKRTAAEPIRLRTMATVREPCMVDMPSTGSFYAADALDRFARDDGFDDWADLVSFWTHAHPGLDVFTGVRIGWEGMQ